MFLKIVFPMQQLPENEDVRVVWGHVEKGAGGTPVSWDAHRHWGMLMKCAARGCLEMLLLHLRHR